MKYDVAGLADKPNECIFLEGWLNPEDNTLYFGLGKRGVWFKYYHQGYIFVGNTKTVCVYPPPYGRFQGLDHEKAKKIAIAYVTGNCIRIDIDLRDRS